MKKFLFTMMITVSLLTQLFAQELCPPACCPEGSQVTFEGSRGTLSPLTNGGWETSNGSAFYDGSDGCTTPTSISLSGTSFSPGEKVFFTESGFGGPVDILTEGVDYCIWLCIKNINLVGGAPELYAGSSLISTTNVQTQSDGWVTFSFRWSASSTEQSFSVKNNSTGPVDNPPTMLFDDVCISVANPNNEVVCKANFAFEELE